MAKGLFAKGKPEIEHARFPADGEWKYGGSSNEYIVYDLDNAAKEINAYLYDDEPITGTAQAE